jgi:tripeptide aminopeptidase
VVYSSGDTVLGGDDKSALAPMLEALTYSLKTDQPRPNLIVTWTAQEELGAAGAAKMDPRWYVQKPFRADLALSFDINGEQGTVVFQAPQLTLWDAEIQGKSAHAGIEPEKAVNALKAAIVSANQIPLGRLDSETTVNIGKIQSGEKFNIVPGSAQMSGEVRSFTPGRVEQELSNIQQALNTGTKQVPGTTFKWRKETLFEAYRTDLELPVFEPLKAAFKETKLLMKPIRTTGGSDANVFAKRGIPSVVLSGAYYNPHQPDEFVRVRDMATQAQLLLNIWRQYAKK